MLAPTPAPTFQLYYGSTLLAFLVVPDSVYPSMYRVKWPDGRLSDICNLSRAKDAAVACAERGPPRRRDTRMFRWKAWRAVRAGPLARLNGGGHG
jgi:hypothetical protein